MSENKSSSVPQNQKRNSPRKMKMWRQMKKKKKLCIANYKKQEELQIFYNSFPFHLIVNCNGFHVFFFSLKMRSICCSLWIPNKSHITGCLLFMFLIWRIIKTYLFYNVSFMQNIIDVLQNTRKIQLGHT